MSGAADHWDKVYAAGPREGLSWYEPDGGVSARLIAEHAAPVAPVVMVGAGRSRLPGALRASGFGDVTALDLSDAALEALAAEAAWVRCIRADVTRWVPERRYGVWQDRAVFHFLTTPEAQAAYRRVMVQALAPGGIAVIGTFDEDGPERCSGLPVQRWSGAGLEQWAGADFVPRARLRQVHVTPQGREQPFVFVVLERV